MRHHLHRCMAWLAPALLLGCASADGPGGPVASVDGLWDWTISLGAGPAPTCSDTGSMRLSGSIYRATFSGVSRVIHSCAGPGALSGERDDSVVSGAIAGQSLGFALRDRLGTQERCTLTAASLTVSGDSLVDMSGTIACDTLSGSWHAARGRPLESITVTPASGNLAINDIRHFTAELRSAGGARVYLRPLVWLTGDPATATISSDGDALAVGPGIAAIRSVSGDLAGSASLAVPAPAGYVSISGGNANTCALTGAGATWCWGLLGSAGKVPTLVAGGPPFTALTVGTDFACGLTAAGAAWCWGDNLSGKLGDGTTASSTVPVAVAGGHAFVAISAGGHDPFSVAHACALTAAGEAWCWGDNTSGQLGSIAPPFSLVPVKVPGGLAFGSITAGGRHTCAITFTGRAFCWGSNGSGQLGDGTLTGGGAPQPVAYGGLFWQLSAGMEHTCGIAAGGLAGGTGYCWGINTSGQLGDGTNISRRFPVPVGSAFPLRDLSAGAIHSCAVANGGGAICWGANPWGQLGDGTMRNSLTPIDVSGPERFARISAGVYLYSDESHNSASSAHSCAVTAAGIAWCWGDNLLGQLGSGLPGEHSTSPARVANQQ